jgi:3-phosphoshikimate 1-carboxyvinyltransferase
VKKETVIPAKNIKGKVVLPGDKSMSHRYAMMAGLAEGTSELHHFSAAADCHSTLGCMSALGADVKVDKENDLVRVTGRGFQGLKSSWRSLDAGNSGTTIRLLSGILAGQDFTTKISGDESLQKRPMKRIMGPLREMGAEIKGRDDNFAPLEIRGGKLHPIDYKMPMASAQVKSAVLLAGLFADGVTSVTEPARTRDHTELVLEEFGAEIEKQGKTVRVHGLKSSGRKLVAKSLTVPGDLSSAVFWIAAASLFPDSNIVVEGVGLNPTRTEILDLFASLGARIEILDHRIANGEVIGNLVIEGAPLKGGVIAGGQIPLVIDELPMLAALGPYTEQGIEIRDAQELRVKESDRISALVENLKRMNAKVEERPDGLKVEGRSAGRLRGAEIEPHGDHRIAMAFAIAALGAEGNTIIRDSECAGVSYPSFFADLQRMAER